MAIANVPQNFFTSQGNGQAFLQWDIAAGATSYTVQRSTDGVTYSTLASPTTNYYLDTTVSLGTLYYYQVASTNASGTSGYTTPQTVIPAPTSELSLGELRLRSQQRADRVNSQFVTTTEWNFFIDQAMYELYDLLIAQYEDYFVAPTAQFTSDGTTFLYPLPNGVLSFTNQAGASFVAAPFYKLMGVDLGLQTSNNAYVTVDKFMMRDRNSFVYPNTASTIYGVFNLQYRLLGTNIMFIPTPSSGQVLRLWYVPRLPQLLQDTDLTTLGFSGWLQYVIIRAAKYALDKEESDTSKLDSELLFLKNRIEETAMNRDQGQPDRISNVRQSWPYGSGGGYGFPGTSGGWGILPLFPALAANNSGDMLIAKTVFNPQLCLSYIACGIIGAYLLSYFKSNSGVWLRRPASAFLVSIKRVIFGGAQKQMIGPYTKGGVTPVTNQQGKIKSAIYKFIRKAMRPHLSWSSFTARVISLGSVVYKKTTVAPTIDGTGPQPTIVTFHNLTPEPILNTRTHKDIIQ